MVGTPASRGAKRRAVLVAVIVVVLIIAGVGAYLVYESTQTVNVNQFLVYSPGNVCGLGLNPIAYNGFADVPGGIDEFEFQVPNYNLTTCTVHDITTNTSGFAFADENRPISISGATVAGPGYGYVNITIHLPSSVFSGNLNMIVG